MRKLKRVRDYFDREGDDYDRYFKKKKFGFQSVGRIVGSIYGGKAVDGRLNAVVTLCGDQIAGKKVLEVGCGPGHYSIRLAKLGAVMTGIDFAPRMIHLAESKVKESSLERSCKLILGDFVEHDFGSDRFDISFATGVFDYIPPEVRIGFLQKMRELSNDFIIASFPKKYVLHAAMRKLWLGYKNVPVYFYTQAAIDSLFAQAGLEEVDQCDVGVLVVKKARAK